MKSLLDEAYGDYTSQQKSSISIGPLLVLIPLGIFVLPLLVASVLLVTCCPSRKGGPDAQRRLRRRKLRRMSFGDVACGQRVGISDYDSVVNDPLGGAKINGSDGTGGRSRPESKEGIAEDATSRDGE